MAENILTQVIPPGTIPIFSTTTSAAPGTTTLYTAGTRRRLHIVSLVISTLGGSTSGVASILVTPENMPGSPGGVNGQVLTAAFTCQVSGAANQMNSATLDPIDLPTVANVTTNLTGTATQATFTLVGWEETSEK